MADRPTPTLTVVMPAYNEAGVIRDVVSAWDHQLETLGIPHEIRVYDDGSRDGTGELLAALARERPAVTAVRQTNRGHGPTVLRGYAEAGGEWVFQTDSDDEMGPEPFARLWQRRHDADVVLVYREGRTAPLVRRIVTAVAAWTIRVGFGARVRDPNAPYRLFRRAALARLLPAVPADAFAPNVILTGLACGNGLRVVEVPVPYRRRRTGTTSIARLRLLRGAALSFVQTVRVARARSTR